MFLVTLIALLLAHSQCNAQLFSYDPDAPNGPAHWGTLDIPTNQCAGSKNSPVAIKERPCDRKANYAFQPGTCTLEDLQFELFPNVVESVYPSDDAVCTSATLGIPGVTGSFRIKQLHIHLSSEHTLNGEVYGAELHLVHQYQVAGSSRLAVVGVFIEPGSQVDNPLFAPLIEKWNEEFKAGCVINIALLVELEGHKNQGLLGPAKQSHQRGGGGGGGVRHRHLPSAFNVYDLVPAQSAFYTYEGSLTTPPCSEVVSWNVADRPLIISVKQYEELVTIILNFRNSTTCAPASIASPSGSTSRPVQPLNGRKIRRICPDV